MLKAIFTTFPFFVCAFWMFVLIFDNRISRNKARTHLIFFMMVSAFLYFCHCIYYNGDRALFILYDALYSFSNLATYPLFFLYILSLTKPEALKFKTYLLLLLPSFIIGISSLVSTLMMTPGELSWYIDNVAYSRYDYVSFFWGKFHQINDFIRMGVFALQIIPIVYYGLKSISNYNNEIRNYYSSDVDKKTFSSISRLMIYILVISLCSFAANFLGRQVFNASALLIIPSFSFGVMLFAIGYVGGKIEFVASDFLKDIASDEKNLPVAGNDDKPLSNDLSQEIVRLISSRQLYKKQDLKVTDIAALLNTNRTYVYQAINVDLNVSFSDLINHYRVDNAKKMLSESKAGKLDMQEIIEESGFQSESSFYRIFKKVTGMTPNQWVLSYGTSQERK